MKAPGRARFAPAAFAAASLLVGTAAGAQSPAPELSIHFLDVAQGDATLVTCPNGATILIDAGSKPLRAAVRARTRAYVLSQIAPLGGDIDYLILSHPDEDHYNLLQPVLAGVPIGRTYYVGDRHHYAIGQVFDWLSTAGSVNVHLGPGDFDPEATPNPAINCGDAHVWILAAAIQAPNDDKNTKSVTVMIRMGDFEAVITGDATFATETAIMSRYTPAFLDIDVLQVGHHGSASTSTSDLWAQTLSPRTAIMSAGLLNDYGHPRRVVTTRLQPQTDPAAAHRYRDVIVRPQRPRYRFVTRQAFRDSIYSTSTSGTIVVRTGGTGYRLVTER